ncbi:MAG: hypothetical protein R8G66_28625 [Cytophagales bacterium]|nr:hypothetical protein [Cytophagales bacterium]
MRLIHFVLLIATLFYGCTSSKREVSCDYIADYYQSVYLAEKLYHLEDYDRAFKILNGLSKTCDLLDQTIIYELRIATICAIKTGYYNEALDFVRQMFEKGYELEAIENHSTLSALVSLESWPKVVADYPEHRRVYENNIHYDIRQQLEKICQNDQLVRNNEDGIDWEKVEATDTFNQNQMKEILNEIGYPNELKVGPYFKGDSHMGVNTLFMHFSDTAYFKPILLEEIRKGHAPPSVLGSMIDSRQRASGRIDRFLYGIYQNATTEDIFDYPNLDNRGMAIGLAPLSLERELQSLRQLRRID